MGGSRRWRWLGVATLALAVAATGAAVAATLLTFNGSGTGSASTSAVTLAVNASATHSCSYDDLEPGDLSGQSSPSCSLSVAYTGSVPAFVSLSVVVETQAGPGPASRPLYNPTASSGLTFSIHDDQSPSVTYGAPTAVAACPPTAPAGSVCYSLGDQLVSTVAVAPGRSIAFALAPSFDISAGNPYQGGRATVELSVQAVQAAANPLPSGCSTGQPCPPSGSFSWS